MPSPEPNAPPSYLLIGHVTRDLTPEGERIGGTATYAGLTAAAYGARTLLLTACAETFDLSALNGLEIHRVPSAQTTTYENRYHGERREQRVTAAADSLTPAEVPADWQSPSIIHLAPLAGEAQASFLGHFPHALRCATLQGWMRTWGSDGIVHPVYGREVEEAAGAAEAVVFSLDDAGGDEALVERLAQCCPISAVTEGPGGCRVYWNGHVRRFPAPSVKALDLTGAGDIFAAVFFLRLHETRDAFEAARMAVRMASQSVARRGIAGVPSRAEILEAKTVIEEL